MAATLLEVPPEQGGSRLDQFVQQALAGRLSRAQVQRLLKQGLVTVAGRPARPSQRVKAGLRVEVVIPEPEPLELTPQPMELEVLYEDKHLIVVNKAPGVVVHPAPGHHSHTLVHGLLHHCQDLSGVGGKLRPGIVHRLDKDTSGALVAAKSDAAHRGLVAAFAAGRVDKRYLALVWGRPALEGRVEAPIGRHPVDRKRMSGRTGRGKPALSTWRVARRYGSGLSLLRVTIHTGRTHQIRVHLAEAGHPLAGDPVYGGRARRRNLPGAAGEALRAAGRQMLHAVRLEFDHPVDGGRLSVWAPLAQDFRAVLRALEQEDA